MVRAHARVLPALLQTPAGEYRRHVPNEPRQRRREQDACCLQDEGQQRALLAVRLEGAEVRAEPTLGRPFVFRCCPRPGCRVFFFCATSGQEMKR